MCSISQLTALGSRLQFDVAAFGNGDMPADFTAFLNAHILFLDLCARDVELCQGTADDFQPANPGILDVQIAESAVFDPQVFRLRPVDVQVGDLAVADDEGFVGGRVLPCLAGAEGAGDIHGTLAARNVF